jgi:predicted metal-dependent enzyme (double-stranded beta helix superfamily)
MHAPATTVASRLDELIAAVREIVQRGDDAAVTGATVANVLRDYVTAPDLLSPDQIAPDASGYRQHILHVEPDGSFSIVALVWLPGQATPIHDHVSWCVVGVHRGEEHETAYELRDRERDPHLVVTREHVNGNGSIASLVPPGDIHQVRNGGSETAVSLHIYGADIRELGCSIRRRYDYDVRGA